MMYTTLPSWKSRIPTIAIFDGLNRVVRSRLGEERTALHMASAGCCISHYCRPGTAQRSLNDQSAGDSYCNLGYISNTIAGIYQTTA
jgi:hypothetical protein